jgi:hypothetical protein
MPTLTKPVTFILGSELRSGDLIVRPYGNVPGKHPTLGLIRVLDIGETGLGSVSIVGTRTFPGTNADGSVRRDPDGKSCDERSYSIPTDMPVLLLDRYEPA